MSFLIRTRLLLLFVAVAVLSPLNAEADIGKKLPLKVKVLPNEVKPLSTEIYKVKFKLPKQAVRVEIFAYHGGIKDLKVVGKKSAEAVYVPPEEFIPRMDVVAALVELKNGKYKWGVATVSLMGQGEAVIKTRPFAEAILKIGDQEFESAKANKKGKARVQVVVPPGVSVGFDEHGAEIDLGVPPVERTAIFASKAQVKPKSEHKIEILVVTFDSDGSLDSDAEIEIAPSDGKLGKAKKMGDGTQIYELDTSAIDADSVRLEASVKGREEPSSYVEIVITDTLTANGGVELVDNSKPEADEGEDDTNLVETDKVPWINAALKLGFASNMGAANMFAFGADLAVKLPVWNRRLGIGAQLEVARTSGDANAGQSGTEAASTDSATWLVPISGFIFYRQPLGSRWNLVPSIHAAAVLVDNTLTLTPIEGGAALTKHERDYYFGLGGGVAIEFTLNFGAMLLQVDYLMVNGKPETVEGSLSLLSVMFGYRIFLIAPGN